MILESDEVKNTNFDLNLKLELWKSEAKQIVPAQHLFQTQICN